ncbi:hypothetical protein HCN44_003795 [Aphidius gifuensis]|uniref:Guanine nucleotide-binding protein-like 3 homolog n=1 Tax=Aphidius gifuensis TaxID=684658 RepID=A0A835CL61_APHGI|nr:guanine nucleotide-binding protein-like 3 homolog [Aphidius gifuensis]KAF7987932.1 hypothetical protein HCN44_003795 [Aphidius gifuensis]
MAKLCLKKPSKRIQARQRYKVEKKVREHNRKLRKIAKKNPKKTSKPLTIPNICPFKEDILKEVEEMRRQNEEEKQKRREEAREIKKSKLSGGLEGLVSSANNKQMIHEVSSFENKKTELPTERREENSLKAYYKEFKKVLDSADVILEVVDARDPLGTRCKHVEEAVRSAKGNKKLVLVLNKADLVPRDNLDQWLRYLRASLPAVAFKASTQDQSKKLGRKKLGLKNEKMIQSGTCFGAELLLSLLGNYCRNGPGAKSSIRVGIVGLPNVGKSSIINSLKRSKACNVGSTPGVTKAMQVVQLDTKVKLLDSPGIVFADSNETNETSVALKNAVKIQALKDPFTPATAVLRRIPKQQIMQLYDILDFSTPDEFFAKKAARMGMFRKGGVPDSMAAARGVLNDWNSGKIRYYTVPPEVADTQISSAIVMKDIEEFDIEKFTAEEQMMLDNIVEESENAQSIVDPLVVDSTGPVESIVATEMAKKKTFKLKQINEKQEKKNKSKPAQRKKKVDPLFEIEGNQKINKMNKLQFKKQKKELARKNKST